MLRSEGKMPDGVDRLPHNRVSYADAECLHVQGILHVDVTDCQGAVTDSIEIGVVRYVEIRGVQVWEAETRDWGYVGYFDEKGVQRFRAGFIRLKCEPGTNGTPELPKVEKIIHQMGQEPPVPGLAEAHQGVLDMVAERLATREHNEATARLLEAIEDEAPDLPGGTFAQEILDTVTNRGNAYGHPSVNHQLTADLWSSWLSRKTGKSLSLSAEDVCILNVLQKLSRLGERSKDDTCLDVMGYMENVSMLLAEQRNHGGELGSTGAGVS